jgi:hypothetical protein
MLGVVEGFGLDLDRTWTGPGQHLGHNLNKNWTGLGQDLDSGQDLERT